MFCAGSNSTPVSNGVPPWSFNSYALHTPYYTQYIVSSVVCSYLLMAGWPFFSNKGKDAHPQLNSLTSPVFYAVAKYPVKLETLTLLNFGKT